MATSSNSEPRVGGIAIHPNVPPADDEYTPAQRKVIVRGIAQSEKQYAAGKSYGPFDIAAEAIASIDANLRRRGSSGFQFWT